MKKLFAITLLAVLAVGCSHNLGSLAIGKKVSIGSPEYGNFTWVDGFFLFDCPRENSYWEIEIDENAGITFDQATKTLKGVKRIRRCIGRQVTGYLVDVAKHSPGAAVVYLDDETVLPVLPVERTDSRGGDKSTPPAASDKGGGKQTGTKEK